MKNLNTFLLLLFILFPTINCAAHTNRNIIKVNINSRDQILCKGRLIKISQLKEKVKEYIWNPFCDYSKPETKQMEIEYFGVFEVSKAIVSIQCARGTSYGFYLSVSNEIEKAYNELRDELALKKFGKKHLQLEPNQRLAINKCIPKRISEAEPNYVLQNGKLVENKHYWYWW